MFDLLHIFIPSLGQKFQPFDKLLPQENAFTITIDHNESFNTLKAHSTRATDLTQHFAKLRLQYVILCDSSFRGTGFVLMVEEYLNNQKRGPEETYTPVFFGA